jgi:medium-chain acyl-[acyl-carrier-protein] hydrolase
MDSKHRNNPWLILGKPNHETFLRLFCFPYGGGGASIFRQWQENMPEGADICPVQLPGRENRIEEPLFTEMSYLIEVLVENLRSYFDIPFALFGHSMGGLIAFELARYLSHSQVGNPVHIFVSAAAPLHIIKEHIRKGPLAHQLPEVEFVDLIRSGGIPEIVLQSDELMEIIQPILRADSTLMETLPLPGDDDSPLSIPLTAFGGTEDDLVTPEMVDEWSGYTSNSFTKIMIPGDHYFIHSEQLTLLQSISQTLLLYFL